MRTLLALAAALFAACASGVVDEPPPTEQEPTEPPPDASTSSAAAPDADAPAPVKNCERRPTVEEIVLPDGRRVSVVIYVECREAPSRDLGDPPPGPR